MISPRLTNRTFSRQPAAFTHRLVIYVDAKYYTWQAVRACSFALLFMFQWFGGLCCRGPWKNKSFQARIVLNVPEHDLSMATIILRMTSALSSMIEPRGNKGWFLHPHDHPSWDSHRARWESPGPGEPQIRGLTRTPGDTKIPVTSPGTCPKTSPKLVENMSETCPKHVQNISKTYPKHVQNISKTCPKHVQDMSKTCPRHVQDMSKTCPRHVQDMSKTCPRHVQDMSKTCPRHVKDMSKTCPIHVHVQYMSKHVQRMSKPCLSHVQHMSKTCPKHIQSMSSTTCPQHVPVNLFSR